jgi:hypothetical protein
MSSTAARQRSTVVVFLALLLLILIYTVRMTAFSTNSSLRSSISGLTSSLPSFHPPAQPIPQYEPTKISQNTSTEQPQNVAVIIETRQSELDKLSPLLLHFSTILGPSWPIHLFLSPSNTLPPGAPLARLISSGAIVIRHLRPETKMTNRGDVSGFLTSPWLWEQLAPAGHILIFQSDSIICANSDARASDFLHWDFIGAPISTTLGVGDRGLNGGLSLRNRSMILNVLSRFNWREEIESVQFEQDPTQLYEDQWFYKKIEALGGRLPREEEAREFAVETVWWDRPWGYHQVGPGHWWADRVEEVDRWCPERRLISSEKITDL